MRVGYARTSTSDQTAGYEVQITQLTKTGCEKIFQEQISAVAKSRPELEKALDFVREGDVICVTRLDRLCRSMAHFVEISERLNAKGVGLQVLAMNLDTTTPTGKLMTNLLVAVAQFERELLLERQRDGIRKAKEQGKYRGRKPTARMRAAEVLAFRAKGLKAVEISDRLGISAASVYRILAA